MRKPRYSLFVVLIFFFNNFSKGKHILSQFSIHRSNTVSFFVSLSEASIPLPIRSRFATIASNLRIRWWKNRGGRRTEEKKIQRLIKVCGVRIC